MAENLLLRLSRGYWKHLKKLVSPETYGNPENPLRWTTKSLRKLAEELTAEGFTIKKDKVGDLLKMPGYSLLQNQINI